MSQPDVAQAADLLWWLVKHGFTKHVMGPVNSPHVIVMHYDWGQYLDVAHVRGPGRAEAARIPKSAGCDVYRPKVVVWHKWGAIEDALAALKDLPPPGAPGAPVDWYATPRELAGIPGEGSRELLTISPEESGHVHIRLANQRPPDRA